MALRTAAAPCAGFRPLVGLTISLALHALVLLTMATIVLELASAREALARGETGGRHMAATVGLAVKNAVIHPVPLPILCGLAFAQTGLALPAVVDKPLQLLGQAFAPLALVLAVVESAVHSSPAVAVVESRVYSSPAVVELAVYNSPAAVAG